MVRTLNILVLYGGTVPASNEALLHSASFDFSAFEAAPRPAAVADSATTDTTTTADAKPDEDSGTIWRMHPDIAATASPVSTWGSPDADIASAFGTTAATTAAASATPVADPDSFEPAETKATTSSSASAAAKPSDESDEANDAEKARDAAFNVLKTEMEAKVKTLSVFSQVQRDLLQQADTLLARKISAAGKLPAPSFSAFYLEVLVQSQKHQNPEVQTEVRQILRHEYQGGASPQGVINIKKNDNSVYYLGLSTAEAAAAAAASPTLSITADDAKPPFEGYIGHLSGSTLTLSKQGLAQASAEQIQATFNNAFRRAVQASEYTIAADGTLAPVGGTIFLAQLPPAAARGEPDLRAEALKQFAQFLKENPDIRADLSNLPQAERTAVAQQLRAATGVKPSQISVMARPDILTRASATAATKTRLGTTSRPFQTASTKTTPEEAHNNHFTTAVNNG